MRRNIDRFPDDFMFQLTQEEMDNWKSQIVISNKEKRGLRKRPYAFTQEACSYAFQCFKQQKSDSRSNIQIMRVFIQLRELIAIHGDLRKKLDRLEKKYDSHDKEIKFVFEVIKQLLQPKTFKSKKIKKIGFHSD